MLSSVAAAESDRADADSAQGSPCHYDQQFGQWQCNDGGNALLAQDWLNKEQLAPEQQALLGAGCSGMYIDPFANHRDSGANMAELPLLVEADRSEVIDGSHATLEGEVRVSQGPRSIQADQMHYDRSVDSAELKGNVLIRQPGLLLRGSSAEVSTVEERAEFNHADVVLHAQHMRGKAESIVQQGLGQIVLKNGSITSCGPDSDAWLLEGGELGIDEQSGQGYGKHVRLKLADIPVFYLPYMTFPVGDQRRSGFLFPSVSVSTDDGVDISVPYYLNLAPNYDATLTPRYISQRGFMLEAELRQLSTNFENLVSGAFLPNDGGNKSPDGSDNEHTGEDRWLLQFRQNGGRGAGWYSQVDYNQVSDEDYFRDLGTSSFEVANTTYLDQKLLGGTQLNNWDLRFMLQDYQTLLLDVDSPYRKLPELLANGNYRLGGSQLSLDNQFTHFAHDDLKRLDGSTIITGRRAYTDYRLGHRFANAAGYIKPELGYKHLYYNLDNNELDPLKHKNIALGAAQASLDASLVLEHPGGNYLQTLEPRIYYLFREYEDHRELYDATAGGQDVNFDSSTRTFSYGQLYRDTRFSGADRLDDANRITVGLTNRWQSHKDGHEYFAVSFGQINHFKDRRIGLEEEISAETNSSEIAFEFNAQTRQGSGLFGNLIYDDAAEQMSRFSAGYNYTSSDYLSLLNLSYSYVREDPETTGSRRLDQVDLGFVTPISRQWHLLARSNYDFEGQRELETFGGIEYNDCCYRVRFLARRWLDSNINDSENKLSDQYDRGLYLEIELKGLGSSGERIYSLLKDAIPGYDRREQQLSGH
ncbi:LPS-assembly protein LptD [Agaribacterium haliotis]|uniref:LPS-assembly protein LptD n=1 Tax=Agaribacterium haliotis TaxID=2013869 RepID=UPI000BB56404|nr:LPS-assembly protein LptD [Agaribacterium haliotis]